MPQQREIVTVGCRYSGRPSWRPRRTGHSPARRPCHQQASNAAHS